MKKMGLNTIHHIAVICSDKGKALDFYVNKLGFPVIRSNYRPERDDWKIDLQCGDFELELFIMKDHPARLSPEAYGLRHLAFKVESVDAEVAELKSNTNLNLSSCVLSKNTEQTADAFCIRDCRTGLKALSAFIPGFRNGTAYAFAGQLVMDHAVAFDLSKAHFSDYDEEYNNP